MTAFEERLRLGLDELANAIEVRAVGGSDAPTSAPERSGRAGRAGLVAAAVAVTVAGTVGLSRLDGLSDGNRTAIAPAQGMVAPPEAADSVVLWIGPDAPQDWIDRIATWLDKQPDVIHYTYLDQDANYVEFASYYADQPEVVELVQPEQLPSSFRVEVSGDPAAWSEQVPNLPGIIDCWPSPGAEVGPR
jgi:hypothetical protein